MYRSLDEATSMQYSVVASNCKGSANDSSEVVGCMLNSDVDSLPPLPWLDQYFCLPTPTESDHTYEGNQVGLDASARECPVST